MLICRAGWAVNDEVLKLVPPVHILEKLLYHPVLLRSSPDHCLVLVAQEEAYGNHPQVVEGIYLCLYACGLRLRV